MKVAVDIDEVVVEYLRGFCDFYNKDKDKKLKYEDFKFFSFEKVLGISERESDEVHREYTESKYFENIGLVDRAAWGVNKLAEDNDLVFITARPIRDREKTIDFLKKTFPEHSFDVYFEGVDKHVKCKELGVGVLIEDGFTSQRYAEKGVNIILLDKKWNKDCLHENIYRCFNWEEIVERVREVNDG